MSAEPDAVEIRVVGALLEKQRTTPEAYPLSVNALRLACNQSTNRDPVVDYDERTVVAALERLHRRGWTRMASGPGSRARKYRHMLDRALSLERPQLAVLCVLMLRGPQTPGELKQRTDRLHAFPGLAELERVLETLIERGLAVRLERRPGQKEQRYAQVVGEAAPRPSEGTASHYPAFGGHRHPAFGGHSQSVVADPPPAPPLAERLDRMERELGALKAELASLRQEAASMRDDLGARPPSS